MSIRFAAILSLFLALFLFSSCAVGPDYERPVYEMPGAWRVSLPEIESTATLSWWNDFRDEKLTKLIEQALRSNLDLLRATAMVDQYYARYDQSRSEFFPQIGSSGNYSRIKNSQSQQFPLPGAPLDRFEVGASLSWELDLWGRIRRSTEAARGDILSSEYARKGVVLTVVATVASAYFDLRALDAQLNVAKQTMDSRRKSLNLIQDRFNAGVVAELDVKQVESELLVAEASVPFIEQQIVERENLLRLLLGEMPGDIERGKEISELSHCGQIAPFLPSELLERRPDVLGAEANLAAATARVGLAFGDYFPKFSLTGAYGFSSLEFDEWLRKPASLWNITPGFSWPIFTAGRISGQVDFAEARVAEVGAQYKQTVLTALQEVNNALIGFVKTGERVTLFHRQVEVLRRYLELARVRYDEGQTSFLEVLDAERRYFESQLTLINAQAAHANKMVESYRALGGGWIDEAEKKTAYMQAPQ